MERLGNWHDNARIEKRKKYLEASKGKAGWLKKFNNRKVVLE